MLSRVSEGERRGSGSDSGAGTGADSDSRVSISISGMYVANLALRRGIEAGARGRRGASCRILGITAAMMKCGATRAMRERVENCILGVRG